MDDQEQLRTDTKKLKWYYDIPYQTIAIELLDMDYQAFDNWVNRRCKLGKQRAKQLREYIDLIIE